MQNYLNLLTKILNFGDERGDRTGTGTRALFGEQLRFDLRSGIFPILTTKKVMFQHVLTELLWLIRGDTDLKFLHEHGCHIWDEWADENGELGPVYGHQWRRWGADDDWYASPNAGQGIDQLLEVQQAIRDNPFSRRHIVNSWNVTQIDDMGLPPCHCFFQFFVSSTKELSLHLYQRSADLFIGVPFNISSYALLLRMMAQTTGNVAGELVVSYGDVHIYNNHIDQCLIQLDRALRPGPVLELNESIDCITKFTHEDVQLKGYNPHAFIKAPISV